MSNAEVFLMLWAVGATVVAVIFHGMFKVGVRRARDLAELCADLALGDAKKSIEGQFTVVENDNMRMKFMKAKTHSKEVEL